MAAGDVAGLDRCSAFGLGSAMPTRRIATDVRPGRLLPVKGPSEEQSMKQVVRRAGKQLLKLVESFVGVGPYRRIRHLEETVHKRDEQVQRWQARSRARRVENERLRKRLATAIDRRKELERRMRSLAEESKADSTTGTALESVQAPTLSAKTLLNTAWSGWWDFGKDHLLSRALDDEQSDWRRYRAFIALAELCRAESDLQSELDYLYRAARVRLPKPPSPALLIQLAYVRILAGNAKSAERVLQWVPDEHGLVEKSLLAANAQQVGSEYDDGHPPAYEPFRRAANAVFRNYQLTPIVSVAAPSPHSLPVMRTQAPDMRASSGPRVSVIVPAFNCEATLAVTLDSLEQQEWPDLEVIVVDDGSSDGTLAVAQEFERTSSRIRVISHTENRGAYVARNTGLLHASGHYITVCDAGDWAHPQRIQLQALDLLDSGSLVNWSQWVRCDPKLRFHPKTRGLGRFVHDNPSSLMFDRVVFDACGSWDEIRVSGDTEFRMRIQRILKVTPRRVLQGCPLTIGILEDSSLTQSHDTRGRSLYRGVRHEYLQSVGVARNHAALEARKRAFRSATQSALVVRPPIIRTSRVRTDDRALGIVFVADFSEGCCESLPMLEIAAASARRGRRVGFVHLPASAGEVRAPSPWARARAASIGAEWIAPAECVTSRLIVTTDSLPLWSGRSIDEFPTIDCKEVWIVLRSRRLKHGFMSVPAQSLQDSLAAYFGRAVEKIRYLRDVDWLTNATGQVDPRYAGIERLSGTLEQLLAKRVRWIESSGMSPETGRSYGESTVRLLGCRSCSAGWLPPESSFRALAEEAKRQGCFIQVPGHLATTNESVRDPRSVGALIPEADTRRIDSDRAPGVYGAARGLYLAAPAVGSVYCWEPLVATALGRSVATHNVATPRGNAERDSCSDRGAEAVALEAVLHST